MINRACDFCKVSKKRCEKPASLQAQCQNCLSSGRPCTYDIAPRKPGPKPRPKSSELTFTGSFSKLRIKSSKSEPKAPVPELVPDVINNISVSSSPSASLYNLAVLDNHALNTFVPNLETNYSLGLELNSSLQYNLSPLLGASQFSDTNIQYGTYPSLIPTTASITNQVSVGLIYEQPLVCFDSSLAYGLEGIDQQILASTYSTQIKNRLVFEYGISSEKVELLMHFTNSLQELSIQSHLLQTLNYLTEMYFTDPVTQTLLALLVRNGYLMTKNYPSQEELAWLENACPRLIAQIPESHIDGNLLWNLYQFTRQSIYQKNRHIIY